MAQLLMAADPTDVQPRPLTRFPEPSNATPGMCEVFGLGTSDNDAHLSVDDQVFALGYVIDGYTPALTASGDVLALTEDDVILNVVPPADVPHVHVVEMRHDTTMWNEGHEHADDPYGFVPVASPDEAQQVVDWAKANIAQRTGEDGVEYTFKFRAGLAAGEWVVSSEKAKAVLQWLHDQWACI